MTEYLYELRIPKDRIAVLIGKEGKVKEEIELETKTKIQVDSKEGDVSISGEDALGLYSCREVIMAIGRGFNPDIARLLLKSDYCFEYIDLKEYAGKIQEQLQQYEKELQQESVNIDFQKKIKQIQEELKQNSADINLKKKIKRKFWILQKNFRQKK